MRVLVTVSAPFFRRKDSQDCSRALELSSCNMLFTSLSSSSAARSSLRLPRSSQTQGCSQQTPDYQVFSNPRLFPADPRLPGAPELTPDISASATATSSIRGSPKLASLRDPVTPSGSAAVGKPTSGLASTGSNLAMPERSSKFGPDKELKDALEEVPSKGDNVDKVKTVDLGLPPLFNPKPAGSSGLPPLLSFSKSTPQRRILPDREYEDYDYDFDHHKKNWRSMDNL